MKHLVKKMLQNHKDGRSKKETESIIQECMEKLIALDNEWMKEKLIDLYTIFNGPHFNEETADIIVDDMLNVDGTKGPRWDLDEAEEIYKQHMPNNRKVNKYDFYVILNMMHSDYSGVLGNNDGNYVAMTKAYFNGPDEAEGKAWYQFEHKLEKEIELDHLIDDEDEDEDISDMEVKKRRKSDFEEPSINKMK